MSKKQSKVDSGMANYREWQKFNRKLEKMGMHGTDYYIKKCQDLEAKVKRLQNKIKLMRKEKA